jgi:hypothetical protein
MPFSPASQGDGVRLWDHLQRLSPDGNTIAVASRIRAEAKRRPLLDAGVCSYRGVAVRSPTDGAQESQRCIDH